MNLLAISLILGCFDVKKMRDLARSMLPLRRYANFLTGHHHAR
jgi:hypothetical protein